MLRSLLFNNISLSNHFQNTSKCLIHLNSCLLDKTKKAPESNVGNFENFEQPKKFLNIKSLKDVGLAKDDWIWPKYNRILYPPQARDEPRRSAFVHHMKTYIHIDYDKLWYPATMIRGMSIDEAIKQLSFKNQKGAAVIKDVLIEAQDLAVKEHNVEFKSNLWVCKYHYLYFLLEHQVYFFFQKSIFKCWPS